jgi:hypothetical protein
VKLCIFQSSYYFYVRDWNCCIRWIFFISWISPMCCFSVTIFLDFDDILLWFVHLDSSFRANFSSPEYKKGSSIVELRKNICALNSTLSCTLENRSSPQTKHRYYLLENLVMVLCFFHLWFLRVGYTPTQ